MFILAIVTASVLYSSPNEIRLNKWFFYRDMTFLTLAVGLLFYATKYRRVIDTFMSVVFISLYVLYVIFVVIQDVLFKRSKLLE
jgi:Ca2+/Na+ antiporter